LNLKSSSPGNKAREDLCVFLYGRYSTTPVRELHKKKVNHGGADREPIGKKQIVPLLIDIVLSPAD
jgi:hypothetical protein